MAKLPQITAIDLIKILTKLGFRTLRQEGSHIFLKHDDGRKMLEFQEKNLKNYLEHL